MKNKFLARSYRKWVVVGLLISGLNAAWLAGADVVAFRNPEAIPQELVVKLDQARVDMNVAAQVFSSLEERLGRASIVLIDQFVTDAALFKIRLAPDADINSAKEWLRRDRRTSFVEPNYVYRVFDDGLPNDPEFSRLWGLNNIGQPDTTGQVGIPGADIGILPLWQKGIVGSAKVLVAVIDTGVAWNHPDLEANIFTNPGEAGERAANAVDDDGNGFIDDVHGWTFADKTKNSMDDHNHGSHVAGTIGARGNNAIGVVGVNWDVSILPLKFLRASGSGSLQDAVESINYARLMKAKVMSNSWGGGGFAQSLLESIEAAKDAGILFVAAAGNDNTNNDNSPSYPASYEVDNVVSVAATDNQDKLASFSNYGAKSVHVAAPGVKIYSTVKDGAYATYSGTSMATPHVAGISALLWAANPDWNFSEIKTRLIKTSTPVTALRRSVVARGRVNAYQAFYNIQPPSGDPDESSWVSEPMEVESAHPYENNLEQSFKVSHPGAKYLRVFFEKIGLEPKYDKIFLQTAAGEVIEELTGSATEMTSEYVKGDSIQIRLKTDSSVTDYGFKVTKIQYVPN